MKLDGNKELAVVTYGESPVKILMPTEQPKGKICFNKHWHERMELLYILLGSLVFELEDTHTTVPAGALAIIPPGKNHKGIAGSDGVSYLTFMFDINHFYNSSFASDKFLKPLAEQQVNFVPYTLDPEIIGLIKELSQQQIKSDSFFPLIVIGKIYEIIGLLYRKCLTKSYEHETLNEELKEILSYISNNYYNDISTQTLSKTFGYNEAYLCRKFKSVTGLSPMNYINILRLENAKKLIKEQPLKISDISALCGFSDAGYFARCFKKYYGITPAKYKNS